uniref:Uncharacterized protein n=1 Tax=Myotis myotis TaxID=51298 RepID=A0A7J7ZX16_MYOMY|nr:hypothetical protein mMyoMyo1_009747 [Myotis myotis]
MMFCLYHTLLDYLVLKSLCLLLSLSYFITPLEAQCMKFMQEQAFLSPAAGTSFSPAPWTRASLRALASSERTSGLIHILHFYYYRLEAWCTKFVHGGSGGSLSLACTLSNPGPLGGCPTAGLGLIPGSQTTLLQSWTSGF